VREFWNDESGQDMIEYTLLMAFLVLVSAALFLYNSAAIAAIWEQTTDTLKGNPSH
jgi:Flp pilus assembly pilin Flp